MTSAWTSRRSSGYNVFRCDASERCPEHILLYGWTWYRFLMRACRSYPDGWLCEGWSSHWSHAFRIRDFVPWYAPICRSDLLLHHADGNDDYIESSGFVHWLWDSYVHVRHRFQRQVARCSVRHSASIAPGYHNIPVLWYEMPTIVIWHGWSRPNDGWCLPYRVACGKYLFPESWYHSNRTNF